MKENQPRDKNILSERDEVWRDGRTVDEATYRANKGLLWFVGAIVVVLVAIGSWLYSLLPVMAC